MPCISANFTRMPKWARVLRISIMLLIEWVNLPCNFVQFQRGFPVVSPTWLSPAYAITHTCLGYSACTYVDLWFMAISWSADKLVKLAQRHLCLIAAQLTVSCKCYCTSSSSASYHHRWRASTSGLLTSNVISGYFRHLLAKHFNGWLQEVLRLGVIRTFFSTCWFHSSVKRN